MFWRIFRVALYMIASLFAVGAASFKGSAAREAALDRRYRGWAKLLLRVFGANLRIHGRGHLPSADPSGDNRPRILLSNHQSQLDIPALVTAVDDRVGFVAKKELGRIPLLAYWMRRVGCIFIDRADKQGARRALEKAAKTLGPQWVVVFPEGTRSKTGQLLPVKMGGLRMAILAGARVVPVHVRNTRSAFEARDPKASGSIPVDVRFFPPVDTLGWTDEKASWVKLRDYAEQCWREGEVAPVMPAQAGIQA